MEDDCAGLLFSNAFGGNSSRNGTRNGTQFQQVIQVRPFSFTSRPFTAETDRSNDAVAQLYGRRAVLLEGLRPVLREWLGDVRGSSSLFSSLPSSLPILLTLPQRA